MNYEQEAKNEILDKIINRVNSKNENQETEQTEATIRKQNNLKRELRDLIELDMLLAINGDPCNLRSVLLKYNIKNRKQILEEIAEKNYKIIATLKWLIIQKKYQEALEICSKSIFYKNKKIQEIRVMLLIKLKEQNKALKICNRKAFANETIFLFLKKQILEEQKIDPVLEIFVKLRTKKNNC